MHGPMFTAAYVVVIAYTNESDICYHSTNFRYFCGTFSKFIKSTKAGMQFIISLV